jgi:hypothetical protein
MNGGTMDNIETSTRLDSAEFEIPCRNLRCKEMYYQGDEHDADASGIYWCMKTHEGFGPDGEPCDKKRCCTGRACYLP